MKNQDQAHFSITTLGGGCFWCTEAVFLQLKGVHKVLSGYSGGKNPNPTYREVCGGQSGHAEVIQVYFDPGIISFQQILEVFWTSHDPTTLNRQGNDRGTQYRSVIFYHDEDQKEQAKQSIADVASDLWNDPIVTEISPFETFYPAETHHQDFYKQNPDYGYCRVIIDPKIAKVRNKYSSLLK